MLGEREKEKRGSFDRLKENQQGEGVSSLFLSPHREGARMTNVLCVHFTCHVSFWFCYDLSPSIAKDEKFTLFSMGFLLREIGVAFPGESQLRQSRATQSTVRARCFSFSINL